MTNQDKRTYVIRRVYKDARPAKLIATDLTLDEAQAHTSDPRTADPDGEWMDIYFDESPEGREAAAESDRKAREFIERVGRLGV